MLLDHQAILNLMVGFIPYGNLIKPLASINFGYGQERCVHLINHVKVEKVMALRWVHHSADGVEYRNKACREKVSAVRMFEGTGIR